VIEPETMACPCCQGRLHKIGQDVSEVLDVIPAILRVLRMIRPKYGCRGCEGAVVQAKALPRLIENSMASTAASPDADYRNSHARTRQPTLILVGQNILVSCQQRRRIKCPRRRCLFENRCCLE